MAVEYNNWNGVYSNNEIPSIKDACTFGGGSIPSSVEGSSFLYNDESLLQSLGLSYNSSLGKNQLMSVADCSLATGSYSFQADSNYPVYSYVLLHINTSEEAQTSSNPCYSISTPSTTISDLYLSGLDSNGNIVTYNYNSQSRLCDTSYTTDISSQYKSLYVDLNSIVYSSDSLDLSTDFNDVQLTNSNKFKKLYLTATKPSSLSNLSPCVSSNDVSKLCVIMYVFEYNEDDSPEAHVAINSGLHYNFSGNKLTLVNQGSGSIWNPSYTLTLYVEAQYYKIRGDNSDTTVYGYKSNVNPSDESTYTISISLTNPTNTSYKYPDIDEVSLSGSFGIDTFNVYYKDCKSLSVFTIDVSASGQSDCYLDPVS